MQATLIAYHGDPRLKEATVADMRRHWLADHIIQGQYWSDGDDEEWDGACLTDEGSVIGGCAVGCMTHDGTGGHHLYPVKWGIPTPIAHLEDATFENLAPDQARLFPLVFLEAIPVGADLGFVCHRVIHWLLDPRCPIRPYQDDEYDADLYRQCHALYADILGGNAWDLDRRLEFRELAIRRGAASLVDAIDYAVNGNHVQAPASFVRKSIRRRVSFNGGGVLAAPYWALVADELIRQLKQAPVIS